MIKSKSWFMRRHDYRPESVDLIESPSDVALPPISEPSHDVINVDRTNTLLEEILRIHKHDKMTEYDVDVSDSVSYTLGAGEAVEVSYNVPSNYVMLLHNYCTSLLDDTVYYVYLDDDIWGVAPDMTFIGTMGLAVSPQVTFKMYVLNTHSESQSYISSMEASIRRAAHWEYPTYSYKSSV